MKTVVINSPFTSHIGRMVHVFEELMKQGHEIQFWGSGGTEFLASKYRIPFHHIPLDPEFEMIMQEDLKPEEYYTRVFFPMAIAQLSYVLDLCKKEKPDLLEANTRVFSAVIASEITGIPLMTHCCSGNSFSQAPEDLYGFCVKGNEPEKLKRLMFAQGKKFFEATDQWYNNNIAKVYNLKEQVNAVGLCSPNWAIAHSIRELSKRRIADLPNVILTGAIISEEEIIIDFEKYKPYCYISLGTCPWEKEVIRKRYLDIIASLPDGFNILIGLGSLFKKEELFPLPQRVTVFEQAPQIAALKHAEFMICHGGCQSVHEALYHGKPIIGIPHYAELSEMVNSVEINGAGVRIPIAKINKKEMTAAVEKATSVEYMKNAFDLSLKLKKADGFLNIINLFKKLEKEL